MTPYEQKTKAAIVAIEAVKSDATVTPEMRDAALQKIQNALGQPKRVNHPSSPAFNPIVVELPVLRIPNDS